MTVFTHPLSTNDAAAMRQFRAAVKGAKGSINGPDARPMFDELMGHVIPAIGVTAEEATLGGVPGWWVRPARPAGGRAILYLHGGAYVLGTARAYRNFVGQIVTRSGVPAFVADYGLAPERPFPAAIEDARRAYDALVAEGFTRVALVGDSAGGGLTLALLALVKDVKVAPVAAVAMSPWTDLGLESPSMLTQDADDPLLDAGSLGVNAALYLGDHDRRDPLASPLHSDRSGLPPVLIHVGDAEVLRDDSLRYAEGATGQSGGGVDVHVWDGMTHVFPSSLGTLEAAEHALDTIGAFLRTQMKD
jgi:epsilon-lactone hydrolase